MTRQCALSESTSRNGTSTIFEAASSRLARELAAMEKTDEPTALTKILNVLKTHAPQYYESTTEDA